MQGLHEILEQFLVFQPENFAYVTSVEGNTVGPYSRSAEASPLLRPSLRCHWGRAFTFSLDGYLKNCHSI